MKNKHGRKVTKPNPQNVWLSKTTNVTKPIPKEKERSKVI